MNLKIRFSAKKGSALVSTLVAAGLLSVSGIALFKYMDNFKKTTVNTVERVSVDPLLRTLIINGLKAMLVEKTVNPAGETTSENKYGICSFLKAPRLSHGVTKIKLAFSDKTSFSLSRWKRFFPPSQWEVADASHCQNIIPSFSEGPFSKCFKNIETPDHITYAAAEIVLRQFPSLEEIDVNSSTIFDLNKVIFQLKTAVSVYSADDSVLTQQNQIPDELPPEAGTSYISYQSDIVWSDAVGECHIMASDGHWTVVKMSATGPGTDLVHHVINSLNYSYSADCDSQLNIFSINDSVVQVGQYNNLQLSSITNLNARVACTKNKFSCKQVIKKESLDPKSYDSFEFSFDLFNRSSSFIPITNFNVTLKKGENELDGTSNEKLDLVPTSFYHSNDLLTAIDANTDIEDYNISRGTQGIKVLADNTDPPHKVASYCHNICQNYKPKDSNTYVYPVVNIHEQVIDSESCVFTKDYSDDPGNRVHCIVCHTKACHRFGLGTFGPLDDETHTVTVLNKLETQATVYGLSDEPLDGQVPECISKYEYKPDTRKIPSKVKGSGGSPVGDPQCIAMKINGNDPASFQKFKDNEYKSISCDTKLPVLCFVRGQYLPALKNTHQTQDLPAQVVLSSFENASKTCFELGQEVGLYYNLGTSLALAYQVEFNDLNLLNKVAKTLSVIPTLTGSFASFNLEDSSSNLMYNYINNAARGMFLAPSAYSASSQTTKEVINIITAATKNGHDKVWTAMEWDAEGLVVASPPWAPVAVDDRFSLFHDKRQSKGHRLVLLKDTNFKSKISSKYLALTYNILWKGLVPRPKETQLPFVCKNNLGMFFKTTSQGPLSRGPQICKNAGGLFVPPESGLDWAKLMLELNPNDDYYPFPDPGITDNPDGTPQNMVSGSFLYSKQVSAPMAWVALESRVLEGNTKEGPRAKDLRLYKGHFKFNPEPDPDKFSKSVFLKTEKNEIIDTIFNSNNLKGKHKVTYDKNPIGIITAGGLVPKDKPGTPSTSLLGKFFSLFKLGKDTLTVDNVGSKKKKKLSKDFNKYKQVCLDNHQDEYKPKSLTRNIKQSCPAGTTALDISDDNTLFKPTSYKYLSYWLKNIKTEKTDEIILTKKKLTEAIDKYNNKIAFLKKCGGECSSAHSQCRNGCPACVTVTATVKGKVVLSQDCTAKIACLSRCDRALPQCKEICNDCGPDKNDCDGTSVF